MTNTYQHIYLSPHFDDVALSCGGSIHRQTQAGQPVLIVTVFAAPPPANSLFSPFAQEQHQKWGDPHDAIALRQTEDQAAMEILGADYLWLDFTDCIYRGHSANGPWFYNNDDDLFGNIHSDDEALADQITETFNNQIGLKKSAMIYAPLTVGHHVDHQLIHAMAWELYAQEGKQVVFFEDYPYVDTVKYGNASLSETLTQLENQRRSVKPKLQFFSEVDLKTKIDSISAYASQMETLFGSQAEMSKSLQRYARQVGKEQPAERIWIPG